MLSGNARWQRQKRPDLDCTILCKRHLACNCDGGVQILSLHDIVSAKLFARFRKRAVMDRLLSVDSPNGRRHGRAFEPAAAKTTFKLDVNGKLKGAARTDKSGQMTIKKLPSHTPALRSLRLLDAHGNVAGSAQF